MVLSDNRKRLISVSTTISILIIGVASLTATALLYRRLPAEIPIHWNVYGDVDNYGPRYMAWIFGSIPLLLALLMRILPSIDPRHENYRKSARAYNATIIAIAAVMMILNFLILASSVGIDIAVDSVVKGIIGLLFIVIGNYMGTIRSTFFFGIKTPWTLSSDEVWKKTHRLGGTLFIIAGIAFVAAIFFKGPAAVVVTITGVILAAVVPIVYSWILYRRLERAGHPAPTDQ